MKKLTVGIIGYGNMGSVMAERMRKIRYNFKKIGVLVYDKDSRKTDEVKNVDIAKDIKDLVQRVDTVILAVKPQDFDGVLMEIKDASGIAARQAGPPNLIISVAAGITTAYIERILGNVRVIRAMPNLPAKIGKGITGLCKGRFANKGDLDWSKKLFHELGKVLTVEEDKINAVTAISGSGPAYVCHFLLKGLEKRHFLLEFRNAAEKIGFNRKAAAILVNTTFLGTIAFLKRTNTLPADLIKQVASKGGTTEAALAVLQSGGSLEEAILAAEKRAEELLR